jgi:hypothetical protein
LLQQLQHIFKQKLDLLVSISFSSLGSETKTALTSLPSTDFNTCSQLPYHSRLSNFKNFSPAISSHISSLFLKQHYSLTLINKIIRSSCHLLSQPEPEEYSITIDQPCNVSSLILEHSNDFARVYVVQHYNFLRQYAKQPFQHLRYVS